jgi:hypothetical protein
MSLCSTSTSAALRFQITAKRMLLLGMVGRARGGDYTDIPKKSAASHGKDRRQKHSRNPKTHTRPHDPRRIDRRRRRVFLLRSRSRRRRPTIKDRNPRLAVAGSGEEREGRRHYVISCLDIEVACFVSRHGAYLGREM